MGSVAYWVKAMQLESWFMVQTPLETWLDLGIQPRYEASRDFWVKTVETK